MKTLHCIIVLLFFHHCYGQELDIFQNDSVYRENKIAIRTMHSLNGGKWQKELVTHYDSAGHKTKQYWYWNGEKNYHNAELFFYSTTGQLSSLVNTFATGRKEITTFYYDDNKQLFKRVTLDKKDTTDARTYPGSNTTIHYWYRAGKAYRCDTTIYETETAKLVYSGAENMQDPYNLSTWHYTFFNEFDEKRNLLTVGATIGSPIPTTKRYSYDKRGLLIKKQELMVVNRVEKIQTEYHFTYQ